MSFETAATRGVQVHYGSREVDQTFGGTVSTKGMVKQATWTVDLAKAISGAPLVSNEVLSSSTSGLEQVIPAYAKVLSCRAEVVEALSTTGGSAAAAASFQVGLEQADGTAIDVDGLIDATDGALTIAANDIAEPRGSYLQGGSAALVPDYGTAATPGETVSIGAAAGELTAKVVIDDVTGMTAIAGKLRIVVEYMPEGV
jgi:hypothetical protein